MVLDDGIGFDRRDSSEEMQSGQGCLDIELRAKLIDARVSWTRRPPPDSGTVFFLRLRDDGSEHDSSVTTTTKIQMDSPLRKPGRMILLINQNNPKA